MNFTCSLISDGNHVSLLFENLSLKLDLRVLHVYINGKPCFLKQSVDMLLPSNGKLPKQPVENDKQIRLTYSHSWFQDSHF